MFLVNEFELIQYEYIYVKKSPGIRNVLIPARMVTSKVKNNLKNCHFKLILQCIFEGVLKVTSGNKNNYLRLKKLPKRYGKCSKVLVFLGRRGHG